MFKKTLLLTTLIACLQPALANEEDPLARPLFLRGEMNNWEAPADQQLVTQQGDLLSVQVALQASHGAYKFKIADEKWKADTTYGQFDPAAKVESDKPVVVKAGWQWSDMKFTPPSDGQYRITLDRRDHQHIQVTVSPAG